MSPMYHGMTHIEFTRAWAVYFSLLSECPQTTPSRPWDSPLSGGLSQAGLEVYLLRDLQRVIHFDAEIPDSALQLPVAKQ